VSRYYRNTFSGFGPGGISPVVKTLIIICSTTFLLQIFDGIAGGATFTSKFGLVPYQVTHRFYLWQLVTYIFLHGGFLHILFNMLGLWMFGTDLERLWGSRAFTKFFFICGIGAAITSVIVSPYSPIPIIGASGAIFGLLLAYGVLFPNRIIYLYMIIPIQAKWFVIIMGAITFLSSMSATGSGVAYIAHLGGMLFGFIYLKGARFFFDFRGWYQRWQHKRLRRKFEVYYNERRRDEDQEKRHRWRN